jgi:hypothetical protein
MGSQGERALESDHTFEPSPRKSKKSQIINKQAGESHISFGGLVTLQRSTSMSNAFVHMELNTTDVSKAKTFYGQLFDWKLEDIPMPGGEYTLIKMGDKTAGGIMKHPMPGAPSMWLAYIAVDDIASATQKAKSMGATVVKDVTAVMDMGSFSVLLDPTGAAFALWQNKT